ncbi:MAG TPA: nuclease-related domain-containing protein [Streptosporangiaceae bacterium]|nr:nuclease-related domain-containing protein [Streptosporangiaceae bacterium]
MYEQLWFKDRRKRLRIRGAIAFVALVVGARLASVGIGVLLAAAAAGVDLIYHWRRHAATAVWRRGQRGDRRMARILRLTVELRGYRVLHARSVPDHGTVDQLVIGPTGVWLVHNEAWSPDTELSVYDDKLFIGKSVATRTTAELRDRARQVAELLSRELRTEIRTLPLVVVHGGKLPWNPIAVEGIVVLRPHRIPGRLTRHRHAYYTAAQVDAITEAAVRVLPIGGRMFPPHW